MSTTSADIPNTAPSALRANAPVFTPSSPVLSSSSHPTTMTSAGARLATAPTTSATFSNNDNLHAATPRDQPQQSPATHSLPRRNSALQPNHAAAARSAGTSLPRGRSYHGRSLSSSSYNNNNNPNRTISPPPRTAAVGDDEGPGGGSGVSHAAATTHSNHHPRKMTPQEAYRLRQARASRTFVAKKRSEVHSGEDFEQARSTFLTSERASNNNNPHGFDTGADTIGEPNGRHRNNRNERNRQQNRREDHRHGQDYQQPAGEDDSIRKPSDDGMNRRSNRNKRRGNSQRNHRGPTHHANSGDGMLASFSDTSSNPDLMTSMSALDFETFDLRRSRLDEGVMNLTLAGPQDESRGACRPVPVEEDDGNISSQSSAMNEGTRLPQDVSKNKTVASKPQSSVLEGSISGSHARDSQEAEPQDDDEDMMVSFGGDAIPSGSASSVSHDANLGLVTPGPAKCPVQSSRRSGNSPTLSLVSSPSAPESPEREESSNVVPHQAAGGPACGREESSSGHQLKQMDGPSSTVKVPEESGSSSVVDIIPSGAGSAAASSEARGSMPESGKWCQECAGLGLHLAVLVSQLQKGKSQLEMDAIEASREREAAAAAAAAEKEKKSSWKRTVSAAMLGSSSGLSSSESAKLKAEKSRLEEENAVLRATVEYLYQKIETLSVPAKAVTK